MRPAACFPLPRRVVTRCGSLATRRNICVECFGDGQSDADASCWVCYDHANRPARHPEVDAGGGCHRFCVLLQRWRRSDVCIHRLYVQWRRWPGTYIYYMCDRDRLSTDHKANVHTMSTTAPSSQTPFVADTDGADYYYLYYLKFNVYTHPPTPTHIYVHTFIYIYTYVYTYIYTYTYIYILKASPAGRSASRAGGYGGINGQGGGSGRSNEGGGGGGGWNGNGYCPSYGAGRCGNGRAGGFSEWS